MSNAGWLTAIIGVALLLPAWSIAKSTRLRRPLLPFLMGLLPTRAAATTFNAGLGAVQLALTVLYAKWALTGTGPSILLVSLPLLLLWTPFAAVLVLDEEDDQTTPTKLLVEAGVQEATSEQVVRWHSPGAVLHTTLLVVWLVLAIMQTEVRNGVVIF